jgi:hypothetical protein
MGESIGGDGVLIHGDQDKGVMQQSNHANGASVCATEGDNDNEDNNVDDGRERAEAGEVAKPARTMAARR